MSREMDADDMKEYRWETGYEKTWESIKEDAEGTLDKAVAEIIHKARLKRRTNKAMHNRLGIMRHVFIILDCSEAMGETDLKPSRLLCSLKLLERFIDEFFDQNPIGQLGLIALKSRRAEKLTELAGTSRTFLAALESLKKIPCVGEPSLQNGLEMGLKFLKNMPPHASKEIVAIMGSLSTCDPVDINITIEDLKKEKVRVSVISLSAEIHVYRTLTQATSGVCASVLDDTHYRDLLMEHVDPPPAANCPEKWLIRMGFPFAQTGDGKGPPLSMCNCHLENKKDPCKLNTSGYHCPQCISKYCELPVECSICGLTLISAPHLTRSYHHLFPVKPFKEINFNSQASVCYSCQRALLDGNDKFVYRCDLCSQYFCIDCDAFIHETLHTCVGCNTIPGFVSKALTANCKNLNPSIVGLVTQPF